MGGRAWVVANHQVEDTTKPICITLFELHDDEASARQSAAVLGYPVMPWMRPGQWAVTGEVMLDACEDCAAEVDAFLSHLQLCGVEWRWSVDLIPEAEGPYVPHNNMYASLDELKQALG